MKTQNIEARHLIPQEVNHRGEILVRGDVLEYDGLSLRVLSMRATSYVSKRLDVRIKAVEVHCRVIGLDPDTPPVNEFGQYASLHCIWLCEIPVNQCLPVMREDVI